MPCRQRPWKRAGAPRACSRDRQGLADGVPRYALLQRAADYLRRESCSGSSRGSASCRREVPHRGEDPGAALAPPSLSTSQRGRRSGSPLDDQQQLRPRWGGVLHSPGQAAGSPSLLRCRHEHLSPRGERPAKRGKRERQIACWSARASASTAGKQRRPVAAGRVVAGCRYARIALVRRRRHRAAGLPRKEWLGLARSELTAATSLDEDKRTCWHRPEFSIVAAGAVGAHSAASVSAEPKGQSQRRPRTRAQVLRVRESRHAADFG